MSPRHSPAKLFAPICYTLHEKKNAHATSITPRLVTFLFNKENLPPSAPS